MTLLWLFLAALLSLVAFWWWQGASQMKSLENGEYGEFKITRTSGAGDSYLAWDAENRKIALVNSPVPEFNGRGDYINSRLMTVVFDLSDVASISLIEDKTTTAVHFYFNKQVPAWNIRKELVYISGPGVERFFSNYVAGATVHRYRKNNTGGVDPI